MGWNGLERNRLDFILTDLLPVELSELFSFSLFYDFLLKNEQQKIIEILIEVLKKDKAKSNSVMFQGNWSTKPLKYKILKGANTMRQMSIMQPLSALNLFLFIECYQKDILNFFEKNHGFSIRYHKKNTDLFYKLKSNKVTQYFQQQSNRIGRGIIQQVGNYFKIVPFESINSFTDSRIWRMSNFKYRYYAKIDYKSCFDSIYTHTFTWIIERNVVDAKKAKNSHLLITIDRILQNINGRSSNGIIVGPEFSRMIAEVLLQQIDSEIILALASEDIVYDRDYVAFRYVDDIYLFTNEQNTIDRIIEKYRLLGEQYLLRLNELKLERGDTPCLPKEWLEKTRWLSDIIGNFFYQWKKGDYDKKPKEERFLVKTAFVSVDRIKDEIAVLMKKYLDDRRTIVSFLLSTILNNISKKKNGYTLFGNHGLGRALLLLDMALYIYAFYPSFDQTRKLISMVAYINSEIDFRNDDNARTKLNRTIHRYSFVFQSGNIFDLCDWFPFFLEYQITLDANTEKMLLDKAEKYNDPIIWGNLMLYSRYNIQFFDELKKKLETIIEKHLLHIATKEPMMHTEFWYVLIFHNCPYISSDLKMKISMRIDEINNDAIQRQKDQQGELIPPSIATQLVCAFLQQKSLHGNKPIESFFNWRGPKSFSDQITYRTYQRTIFKRYRKNTYGLYASLD
ncbi:RNA-directed DNA polymerase [Cloacibacillus porcorum]|uniref:RNA-directed DNA polymerase n=1 Tax=Cloacibacillus porcorum TaxID=1197717 RepID=UPI0023F4A84C|nr:RNA-directed DNA polymerase [Cloacibacillus porcorum]MDD7650391.1 RNA-directed DNA polymerase [Cloacibacillus porcorum]MDY4092829.1 RNA-directed DNA polymerase [Cloacibacillus porcorum]